MMIAQTTNTSFQSNLALKNMKVISEFYGVKILMEEQIKYINPIFHASYGDFHGSFLAKELKMYKGFLPQKITSLVLEWAYNHRDEILENYLRVLKNEGIKEIEPLI